MNRPRIEKICAKAELNRHVRAHDRPGFGADATELKALFFIY